jgi:Putative zinc-finger
MRNITNLLKEWLAARPQPQTHPDCDLLNAFMERTLPPSERSRIVLHLSECSYCREVVSLALAEVQPAPDSRIVLVPSRFWTPAFRWAGALAVMAVAATLVVEKPWKTPPTVHFSAVQVPSQQLSAPAVAPAQSTTPEVAASSSGNESIPPAKIKIDTRKPESRLNTANNGDRTVVPQSLLTAAPVVPTPSPVGVVAGIAQSNQPGLQQMANVRTAVPEASPRVLIEEANGPSGRGYLNTNVLRNDRAPSAAAQESPEQDTQASNTKMAFPAISASTIPSRAFAVDLASPATTAESTSAQDTTLKHSRFFTVPRTVEKTVVQGIEKAGTALSGPNRAAIGGNAFSGAGSMAFGNGGAAVGANPNAFNAASGINVTNVTNDKPQTLVHWIIKDGTLMKSTDAVQWHEAYPQPSGLQFKALATSGNQVWAGGSGGTIIHSSNSGVNWETIKVPDAADVNSITVDQVWLVKMSNGKVFASQDHGKTWASIQP